MLRICFPAIALNRLTEILHTRVSMFFGWMLTYPSTGKLKMNDKRVSVVNVTLVGAVWEGDDVLLVCTWRRGWVINSGNWSGACWPVRPVSGPGLLSQIVRDEASPGPSLIAPLLPIYVSPPRESKTPRSTVYLRLGPGTHASQTPSLPEVAEYEVRS